MRNLVIILAIIIISTLLVAGGVIDLSRFTPGQVRNYAKAHPVAASVWFIVVVALKPLFTVLPLGLSVVAGVAFGVFVGTVYVAVGACFSSVLGFYLTRIGGREIVRKRLGRRLLKIDMTIGRSGWRLIAVLRLFNAPWDVVSYAAGLSSLGAGQYMLGTMVGVLPASFVLVYFGSSLNNLTSWQFPVACLLIVLTAAIVYDWKRRVGGLEELMCPAKGERNSNEHDESEPSLKGLIQPGPPLDKAIGVYPNVGVMNAFVEGLTDALGTKDRCVTAPPNSLKTLDLGTRHAPEGACLPFKLIMGNLMEGFEKGANLAMMLTEEGPCRLGFYSLGMQLIFSDLELGTGWIDFSSVNLRKGYLGRFREAARKAGRSFSLPKVLHSAGIGFCRLAAVESLEAERNRLLPYEIDPGSINDCFEKHQRRIMGITNPVSISLALRSAKKDLRATPMDRTRDTVKVVITGEIYCVLDAFANSNIETRLARLGAEPRRVIWQTTHIRYYLQMDRFRSDGKRAAVRAARKYLPEQLGGDCNSNIGHAILAHRRGDDGMVHLKPFGCMLEFVAQNLLNKVEQETGFPILSLTLDDLAAEERINVRLEAFVDNLFRRKRNRAAGGRR
jgi:uncharacterized membrane protein YdjX (TVP38/TMEM64 family)/predicted nucleotide-binding protein (sugar kinase/HSP70/actin superfamily)